MPKEKVLIVGLGEVGRPLFELTKESGEYEAYGFDLGRAKGISSIIVILEFSKDFSGFRKGHARNDDIGVPL